MHTKWSPASILRTRQRNIRFWEQLRCVVQLKTCDVQVRSVSFYRTIRLTTLVLKHDREGVSVLLFFGCVSLSLFLFLCPSLPIYHNHFLSHITYVFSSCLIISAFMLPTSQQQSVWSTWREALTVKHVKAQAWRPDLTQRKTSVWDPQSKSKRFAQKHNTKLQLNKWNHLQEVRAAAPRTQAKTKNTDMHLWVKVTQLNGRNSPSATFCGSLVSNVLRVGLLARTPRQLGSIAERLEQTARQLVLTKWQMELTEPTAGRLDLAAGILSQQLRGWDRQQSSWSWL